MSTEAQSWDDDLVGAASPPPLLQSWAWGEIQSRSGWTIERVRLDAHHMASIQVRAVGPMREAYVPRGPVPASPDAFELLIVWARKAGIARLVVEPEAPPEYEELMLDLGFGAATPVQPQHTRIIKLASPAELLPTFRHGRRYNIRAGQRRGVTVEEGKDAAELARQSAAVERRESISLPGRRYYEMLLDLLPWCRTFTARAPQTHEALATVLVARHGGRAYSLFAGRSGRHSELMGNDLAWWGAISAAAEAGCADFDLWGVPPPHSGQAHPWHGLGAFKAEFGGEEVSYAGAWELILSPGAAKVLTLERKTKAYIRGLKRNIP